MQVNECPVISCSVCANMCIRKIDVELSSKTLGVIYRSLSIVYVNGKVWQIPSIYQQCCIKNAVKTTNFDMFGKIEEKVSEIKHDGFVRLIRWDKWKK